MSATQVVSLLQVAELSRFCSLTTPLEKMACMRKTLVSRTHLHVLKCKFICMGKCKFLTGFFLLFIQCCMFLPMFLLVLFSPFTLPPVVNDPSDIHVALLHSLLSSTSSTSIVLPRFNRQHLRCYYEATTLMSLKCVQIPAHVDFNNLISIVFQ